MLTVTIQLVLSAAGSRLESLNTATDGTAAAFATVGSLVAMNYIILFNCAGWHQREAAATSDPQKRMRHEELADRLFIRAYWARR